MVSPFSSVRGKIVPVSLSYVPMHIISLDLLPLVSTKLLQIKSWFQWYNFYSVLNRRGRNFRFIFVNYSFRLGMQFIRLLIFTVNRNNFFRSIWFLINITNNKSSSRINNYLFYSQRTSCFNYFMNY